MTQTARVRLTGKAARFIALLSEFGHIDQTLEHDVLMTLADHLPKASKDREQVAHLADVRRSVATAMFDTAPELPGGILEDDWPLLFS
jgi:hypothetical protein